jgi:hypothetical protein
MEPLQKLDAAALLEAYDFSDAKKVADIGGISDMSLLRTKVT